MKIILKVTNCLRNLCYCRSFSIKLSWKTSRIQKHENGHFQNSLTLLCDAHHGIKLCGVHLSTESSSEVCISPRSQAPQCASSRGVKWPKFFKKLHGVHHTLTPWCDAHCGVRIKIFESLWLLLKGQWGEIFFGVNTSIIKEKILRKFCYLLSLKFWLQGVMHTAESNFWNFVIEYLGEIKTEFENTLACLSGAQMGFNPVLRIRILNSKIL